MMDKMTSEGARGRGGDGAIQFRPLAPAPTRPLAGMNWMKWLVISIVVAYVALLILAPLAALVAGAFSGGLGAIVAALGEPDVLSAFWRTLLIAVIVVLIHATCGTAVAWVLVRQNF